LGFWWWVDFGVVAEIDLDLDLLFSQFNLSFQVLLICCKGLDLSIHAPSAPKPKP
jgi:hypothetical protein